MATDDDTKASASAGLDALAHAIGSRPEQAPPIDLLTRLGMAHGTDKVAHGFCAFYDRYLRDARETVRKVLEIGVLGGASLRMWRDYFPNASIHGLDLEVRRVDVGDRVGLHAGDQASRRSLHRLIAEMGPGIDLIIDDGGHTMEQQQVSFAYLFPHVVPGGAYIIEDLHTSFVPEIGIYRDSQMVSSYSTGVTDTSLTSFQMVGAIAQRVPWVSEFLSVPEHRYINEHVGHAAIFDRDGDHAHVTSFIRKRRVSNS